MHIARAFKGEAHEKETMGKKFNTGQNTVQYRYKEEVNALEYGENKNSGVKSSSKKFFSKRNVEKRQTKSENNIFCIEQ